MTITGDDPGTLVRRMQECFNTRQFDRAEELVAPDFVNHVLGATGFEAGRDAWRTLVSHFPEARVVAEDILVDDDKVAIRSSLEGIATPAGQAPPMLIEIFRVAGGRLVETWGLSQGMPLEIFRDDDASAGPKHRDEPLPPGPAAQLPAHRAQ